MLGGSTWGAMVALLQQRLSKARRPSHPQQALQPQGGVSSGGTVFPVPGTPTGSIPRYPGGNNVNRQLYYTSNPELDHCPGRLVPRLRPRHCHSRLLGGGTGVCRCT